MNRRENKKRINFFSLVSSSTSILLMALLFLKCSGVGHIIFFLRLIAAREYKKMWNLVKASSEPGDLFLAKTCK